MSYGVLHVLQIYLKLMDKFPQKKSFWTYEEILKHDEAVIIYLLHIGFRIY